MVMVSWPYGPKVDRTTGPSQPLTRPTRYGARASGGRPVHAAQQTRRPVLRLRRPLSRGRDASHPSALSPRINGRSLPIPFFVSSRVALGLDSTRPLRLKLNPQDFSPSSCFSFPLGGRGTFRFPGLLYIHARDRPPSILPSMPGSLPGLIELARRSDGFGAFPLFLSLGRRRCSRPLLPL